MTLMTINQSLDEKESEKDTLETKFPGWDLNLDTGQSRFIANTLLLLPSSSSRKQVDIKHGVSKYGRDLYDVTSS